MIHFKYLLKQIKETEIFVYEEKSPDGNSSSDYPMFGLAVQDVFRIAPNYESFIKAGQFKSIDPQRSNSFAVGQTGINKPRPIIVFLAFIRN